MAADGDPIPLVIVQGFLGSTGIVSWDRHIESFELDLFAGRKLILPSLGAVSSLHDRACELYYSLVGGRVDYGAEHCTSHQHSRYGRVFSTGLYPMWSKERPLHFFGHSVGGPTIIKLQHLIEQGHFGKEAHPDMVLSVNAVCAPFRGTQLVYALGESTTSAPNVRPFSVGAFLAKFVHIIAYFSPLLPSLFDVHADARALSYRDVSGLSFLKQLWKSDWAESKDAAPYDTTFEAGEERENGLEGRTFPNTFYRSHVSVMTQKVDSSTNSYQHTPRYLFSITHTLLFAFSKWIGTFDYNVLKPSPSFSCVQSPNSDLKKELALSEQLEGGILTVMGEEYWANDGVVPMFSQWHPYPCALTKCSHLKCMDLKTFEDKQSAENTTTVDVRLHLGRWSVMTVNGTNHLSLIPGLSKASTYQKAFWAELGHWLGSVEDFSIGSVSWPESK
ncbi:hypothetical protein GALMADRAFT_248263 [Galerina marginata CBS 339.88]|uniref:Lipase-like C-terminal domain-containing protein n=1 Tax=Galerina marginata (strain CBS 339.88) TaxID=685588 RepID=A0A067SXN4_GALM3|nr:hypothetical protein GALMADRAFT_248263 [Galerina marginata CBS 339.88]